jgi:Ser/Thr protein kinase RdoA (MazF antagonist)
MIRFPITNPWMGRYGEFLKLPGQKRHGDLGPWNMVWASGTLVGLIDWDFAEPGLAIDDVAQAAWNCVPLRPESVCEAAGIATETVDR